MTAKPSGGGDIDNVAVSGAPELVVDCLDGPAASKWGAITMNHTVGCGPLLPHLVENDAPRRPRALDARSSAHRFLRTAVSPLASTPEARARRLLHLTGCENVIHIARCKRRPSFPLNIFVLPCGEAKRSERSRGVSSVLRGCSWRAHM